MHLSQIPDIAKSVERLLISMAQDKNMGIDKIEILTDESSLVLAKLADYAKHLDELNEQNIGANNHG